jgi:WD40 repeat protein
VLYLVSNNSKRVRKRCGLSTIGKHFSAEVLGVFLFSILLTGTSFAAVFSEALIAKLECPDRVNSVAFSPDGNFLAAGYGWNHEGGVRVWKASDRAMVYTWAAKRPSHGDIGIERVAFSPDSRSLVAATPAGDILVWKVDAWAEPRRIILKAGAPTALAFSPDARELALSSKFAVFLCDIKTRQCRKLKSRASTKEEFIVAGFSGDGTRLAACRLGAIQWWDVATGHTAKSWQTTAPDYFCTLSSSRKYIVAGGGAILGDKNVGLLDASGGESLARLSAVRSGLFASAISHSDKWIALGGGSYGPGGDLSIWRLRDFQEIGFVTSGRFPINELAFSVDDSVLAAASHDGVVFLFSVEKLRGPERTKQEYALCGEVLPEDGKLYIVPIAKGPAPLNPEFDYAWEIEVVEPGALTSLAGYPVIVQDWDIESDAAMDRARVNKFAPLWPAQAMGGLTTDYAVLGDVQNPDWNRGFVVKVYSVGSFVAARITGECLAYGPLSVTKTPDFDTLSGRLLGEGLLAVPRDPLTLGSDHFRIRFIELSHGGKSELRSDAELIDSSSPRSHPGKKKEEFTRIFNEEQEFIDSLLHAGMHPLP